MNRILFLILLAFFGCERTQTNDQPATELSGFLRKERLLKDQAFAQAPYSPLPEAEKAGFKGLKYFGENPKLRFKLPLHRYEGAPVFKILTSTSEKRDAQKYGYFEFEVDGVTTRLQVYKLLDTQEDYPGALFVPFTDATSAAESYPGGRYLDLHENETGVYEVDFNLAYNPYCAYGNPGYSCPIPPMENALAVAIRAGEKRYKTETH